MYVCMYVCMYVYIFRASTVNGSVNHAFHDLSETWITVVPMSANMRQG